MTPRSLFEIWSRNGSCLGRFNKNKLSCFYNFLLALTARQICSMAMMMEPEGNMDNLVQGERREPAIYTAVPVDGNSKHLREESLPTTANNLDRVFLSCKYYSLSLGVVIGCFIQLASMGAFFLYKSLTASEEENMRHVPLDTKRNQIMFSLVWSAFTSTLGLLLLVLLSSLIQCVRGQVNESLLLHMECYMAVGVVLGLTLTCTLKNCLVGGNVDWWQSVSIMGVTALYYVWQSLVVLGLARMYGRLSSGTHSSTQEEQGNTQPMEELHCLYTDDSTVTSDLSSLSRPLLERTSPMQPYRASGVCFGLVVGCFIQLSCLGANYMLVYLWSQDKSQEGNYLKEAVMFNLVWDLFTTGLGVLVLFLIRRLVLLQWTSNDTPISDKVLFHIESYFAVGSLVGVNLSWVLTNYLMDFRPNMLHSLIMLAVSVFWFGAMSRSASAYNEDDDHEPGSSIEGAEV